MIKYAGKTIIGIAQERGSSATTKSGAWRWLMAHIEPEYKRNPWLDSKEDTWDCYRNGRMDRKAAGRAVALGYDLADGESQWKMYSEAYAENYNYNRLCREEIKRGSYGEAILNPYAEQSTRPRPEVTLWRAAWALINEAERKGKITRAHDCIEFDKKGRADGTAVHHELYDFAEENAAVICVRETEGSRYGVRTVSKTYYLIRRHGKGVRVELTKDPIAKLAKAGATWGSIIARILGKPGAATLASSLKWETAYKSVALVNGQLQSIFNGEPYELGKTKVEQVVYDHGGGYYCYGSAEEAKKCTVPDNSVNIDAPRVVIRCEVAGRCEYYGNKMARTYLRPVEVLG